MSIFQSKPLMSPLVSDWSTPPRGSRLFREQWNRLLPCILIAPVLFAGCLSTAPCKRTLDRIEYPFVLLEELDGTMIEVHLDDIRPDDLVEDHCIRERKKANIKRVQRLLNPVYNKHAGAIKEARKQTAFRGWMRSSH